MNKKFAVASVLICLGAIYRLIPHPHNFTPVAAMALIGGLYVSKKYLAYLVPIMVLFISDLVLNNTVNRVFIEDQTGFIFWAPYMLYTYSAILATVLIGVFMTNSSISGKILGGSLASAVMFFVISNFGTWLSSGIYSKDLSGLFTCFAAGIPFFGNTLLSNLFFVGLFVLTIEWFLKFSRKTVNA